MAKVATTPTCDLLLTSHRNQFGWGGARTFLRGFMTACQERGLRTQQIALAGRGEPPTCQDNRGLVLPLTQPRLLWRFQSWRLAGQIERCLRELPPPRLAFVGMNIHWVIAAKRAWPGVKVVYRVPCLLSNCLPFTRPGRRPPTFRSQLDFAGTRRAERQALRVADLILAPTALARDEILTLQPAAHGRVAVCAYHCQPEAVSDEVRWAHRLTCRLGAGAFVALAVGTCDANKAFDLAIRELGQVDRRGHLIVVGDGPERAQLGRLARDRGLSDRVQLVGAQDGMARWFAAADCVISTSHYDMFPNAIQEAMYLGRPVVVPEHAPPKVYAGAAELVGSFGGGLLYDRRRPGALADALNSLIADSELTAELGRQAARIAHARGGWDRCVAAVLTLCEEGKVADQLPIIDAVAEPECVAVT